eukprot:CAMPEP_0184429304 /NCGR_PEP_ID=MMETSP0738-20130409/233843_1 /TAXON_ID=385413 /ORGANISM="Thalassiosira miniscula, Strain CCMP1093" /LENGTH=31 /DNA_ID= /DNA_START= /DNA_END= /DNA_ORIENTATION=
MSANDHTKTGLSMYLPDEVVAAEAAPSSPLL